MGTFVAAHLQTTLTSKPVMFPTEGQNTDIAASFPVHSLPFSSGSQHNGRKIRRLSDHVREHSRLF